MALIQILILLLLIVVPPILIASLVRIRPVYQLTQRSQAARMAIVAGDGLLYFVISYGMLLWLLASLYFSLSQLDLSQGTSLPPDVAGGAIVSELWLRLLLPGAAACHSASAAVCRAADAVIAQGTLEGGPIFIMFPVLLTTLGAVLLAWRFTRPRTDQQ